jgi:hypothetical protein
MSRTNSKKQWRGADDVYNKRCRTNASYTGLYSTNGYTKGLSHREMRADVRLIRTNKGDL